MLRTFLLITVASAFFAAMHNGVRLTSSSLHPFEIAFFRSLFGLVALAPLIIRKGSETYHSKKFSLHVMRGVFNGISILCWFTALSLLPVAEATSLSLAGPIFVVLGAMVFLGERVQWWQWIGIITVILGGILIVQPGFREISIGAWLVIAATLALTGSKLIAKVVSQYDHPDTVVAYLTTTMMLATLVPAIYVWKWPTLEDLYLLALIGTLGTCGHLCLARAYLYSDVSLIDPLMFMRMIWAALFGYLLFSELPNLFTWVGTLVILIGMTTIVQSNISKSIKRLFR